MKRLRIIYFAVGAFPVLALGQATPYYIVDGDSLSVKVVQGGAIVNSWTSNDNAYPIAVAGTVRTYATYSTNIGEERTLAGGFISQTYNHQGDAGQNLDGGTDGINFNFMCSFNDAGIYRFDRNWKTPIRLFTVPSLPEGMTYDSFHGTLWVARSTGAGAANNVIEQYNMAGTLLSSFGYRPGARAGCLAFEQSTNSLWVNYNGTSDIEQFGFTGNIMNSLTVNGLAGNNWGGEMRINTVPEPATLAALGMGALALLRRRRK